MPMERTLIIIKPDGMDKKEKILHYYEKAGLRTIAMKEVRVDKNFAGKHYAATDEQVLGMGNKTIQASREGGELEEMKKLFGSEDPRKIGEKLRRFLIDFITSRPVLAMVMEGEGAVMLARKVTGFTDPARADKGTVRGDMGKDSIVVANNEGRPVMNLVHASGDVEEAEREIALWFPELLTTKVLLDTNIYGWAVENESVASLMSNFVKIRKDKPLRYAVFGLDLIEKELKNNPHKPTRDETLKLYTSVVNEVLEIDEEVKKLAEGYFKNCKEMRVKITIEDCQIVAAATLNSADFIVTNNRSTMSNPKTLEIFEKVNSDKLKTPDIIDSKEALTKFSF